MGALFFQSCTFVCHCSPVNFCPPRAVAHIRQLAAAAPGHGSQRGGWCCGPFALRRRRSSKSYSGTRQQLLQLWQDTLQLVQGGSGLRPHAVQACDADAMPDVRTPAA